MEKNRSQTYILSVNDFGQKICTSQTEPYKRYILEDDGNMSEVMFEYDSPNSVPAITIDNSNDSINKEIPHLEEPSHLGIINPLDGVADFEENLMNELDSDFMTMIDPSSHFVSQHMDIRQPLSKLKKLLSQRLNVDLSNYVFTLQDLQVLEDHKNLVDQCVQGEGPVQVNVQIQTNMKKINIIDVLKPAEDYIHTEESNNSMDDDTDTIDDEISEDAARNIVQWQVDLQYKKDQERLKIPLDPEEWSTIHVSHWLQWAVRQFNLSNIKLKDWNMTGKELYNLTMEDFQKIVPNDPGDIFWTHLELLRKMKVVAVRRIENSTEPTPKELKTNNKVRTRVLGNSSLKYPDWCGSSGNKSGYNGQIQLWQFLLELLTTQDYKSIIQWTGHNGEFKLTHPEVVAALWGERKNKPLMNYEKLSRALRYYYDGDMISKVHGKRFVYRFVCDLKQIIGYSATELANLVNYGNPMIQSTRTIL